MTLPDAENHALVAPIGIRHDVIAEDDTTLQPNPAIGVPENPLSLPSPDDMRRQAINEIVSQAAGKLLDAAIRARAANLQSQADSLRQAGNADQAIELDVTAALIGEAIDPPTAPNRPQPPGGTAQTGDDIRTVIGQLGIGQLLGHYSPAVSRRSPRRVEWLHLLRSASMSRVVQAILCGLMLSLFLIGCDTGTQTSDADIQVIPEDKLADALAEPQTVLVDVRTPARYASGHLPGAISVPLPDMRPDDARLTDAKQIIVYAGGWTDPLSIAGVKRLMALGYSNVYEFKGGIDVWQDSGKKLITSLPEKGERPETNR